MTEDEQPTQPLVTHPNSSEQPRRQSRTRWLVALLALAGIGLLLGVILSIGRGGPDINGDARQSTGIASPSPAALNPSPSSVADSYTVGPGDTMKSIAQKLYGDPEAWPRIYEANRAAIGPNPDALRVGSELRVPPR